MIEGRLILASASPRRRRLLKEMGVTFDVVVPDVEEVHYLDDLHGSVKQNAVLKCEWCRRQHPDATILAADTGIEFGGRTIMKPRSLDEAAAFLRRFSGHTHTVMTGLALGLPGGEIRLHVESSTVTFRELTESTIQTYIEKVNPIDRAGAYDIDACGDMLVARYDGSFTNIVGLPCEVVALWLRCEAGERDLHLCGRLPQTGTLCDGVDLALQTRVIPPAGAPHDLAAGTDEQRIRQA